MRRSSIAVLPLALVTLMGGVVEPAAAQAPDDAWGEPVKTYYAAQIGCGLGGVPIVEGVPGLVEGVDDSGYVLEDGILTLPESPGFGLDLCV